MADCTYGFQWREYWISATELFQSIFLDLNTWQYFQDRHSRGIIDKPTEWPDQYCNPSVHACRGLILIIRVQNSCMGRTTVGEHKQSHHVVNKHCTMCNIINPRRACATVTVLGLCVCLCVCLMPYFLDTVSLHVESKVPMASVQHCADYYKKGFRDRRFIQKLWRHLLTRDVLRGYCSVIPCTFSTAGPSKGPKRLTIG